MKRIKYYLETTVFNFVFAEDDSVKREITKKLFKNWDNINGEMYISDLVITEINRAPEEIKTKLLKFIEQQNPVLLEIDEEVKELADRYISTGIIPEKYRNDALHIAVAVVNDLDVIISWNLEHIVKLKTKLGVEGVNRLLGYKTIEIMTPEEVI
jgi:predicted nucleic acid-binding protein